MRQQATDEDLAAILAKAAELVKSLPAELRNTAFAKAVDILRSDLLASSARTGAPPGDGYSGRGGNSAAPSDAAPKAASAINRTGYPEIYKRRKILDQCLIVLLAARETTGVDWMSTGDIYSILKDTFRLPVKVNAVGMALSRATQFVDRRAAGTGFEYRLMSPGEKYLAGQSGSAHSETARSAMDAAAPPSREAERTRSASKGRAPVRNSGDRPGPTRLLEDLVNAGFFSVGRTIGDVVEHLAHKRAHRYKTNEISKTLTRMVRSGKLDRDHGNDGQYLYRTTTKGTAIDPYFEGIMKGRDER